MLKEVKLSTRLRSSHLSSCTMLKTQNLTTQFTLILLHGVHKVYLSNLAQILSWVGFVIQSFGQG